MVGQIYCNACSSKRTRARCKCGCNQVYIRYYHEGKAHYKRRLPNGDTMSYEDAELLLAQITIDKRMNKFTQFDPLEYSDQRAQERGFKAQVALWLKELEGKVNAGEMKPAYFTRLKSYDRTHFVKLYDFQVQEITKAVIAHFKNTLNHLKIKTRKNIMSALHVFLEWFADQCEETDLVKNYVVPVFPKIKGNDSRTTKALEIEDQQRYLAEVPEIHRDVIQFAMEIGCRRGELCAYKVKDVDFVNGVVLTERAWSDSKLTRPKNGRTSQKLLSDTAIEICKRNCKDKHPEAWLFINPYSGNHYLPKTIDEIWARTSSPVKFHEATRHSYATRMAKLLPVQMVQILLGHSDIQSTMRYYHGDVTSIRNHTLFIRSQKSQVIENTEKSGGGSRI